MFGTDRDFNGFEEGITRRALIGRGLTAGTALALASSGLLGAGVAEAARRQRPTAAATMPQRGGVLQVGGSSNADSFDPIIDWTTEGWIGSFAIYDRLLSIVGKTPLEPELLLTMPTLSRGGTLYTFKLRPGVLFHHGRELTADDVKFSLERLFNPANKSGGASIYAGLSVVGNTALQNQKAATLSGIKVMDKYTFTIEMEKPDSVLLYVLALPFASIVPRDVVTHLGAKKFAAAPIGSGPFKMTSVNFARGQVLDRNPKYWKPGIPYVDRVNWRTGVDPALSILRIESGQQDMIVDQVPAGSLAAIRNGQYAKQLVTGLYRSIYYFLLPAGQNPHFKDLRVRQAIASAIDKQRIVQVVGGLGVPADGGLFNPLTPFYTKGLAYPYDLAKAKNLMAAAAPHGFSATLDYGNFPPFPDIVAVIQDNLKQIGITVNPKNYTQVPQGVIVPDMNVTSWSQPYPHGSYITDSNFTQKGITDGCCNGADWVDPKLEALLAEGHATSDPHRLAAIYKAVDKDVIRDHVLWVPLFYPKLASLVSTRTHGFTIPPGPIINVKFFSQYWLS